MLLSIPAALMTLGGCKFEVTPKFFYAALIQRASLAEKYPQGFFQLGLMMEEKDKPLLNADNFKGKIERIELITPEGKIQHINAEKPFAINDETQWQGYLILGQQEKLLTWLFVDTTLNAAKLPTRGNYYAKITTRSGSTSSYQTEFEIPAENALQGFPENLKYDPAARTLTWSAPQGKNIHYRVYAFEGEKGKDQEDWSKMVYASTPTSVPENIHQIPASVIFEKGKAYYFMVEAWSLPFFHIQDRKEHIATFIAR